MATATARKGTGKSTAVKRGHDHPLPAAEQAAPVVDARWVEAPPNAFKTLSALREMGYGSVESVADLVDNCIDAGAGRVAVQVKSGGKESKHADGDTGITIDVLDDGKGMGRETLNQALRLGSDTGHGEDDLGKYGMGLVTASLGMARSIYVLTRTTKAQAFEATLDIDDVAQHNKFLIALVPVVDSSKVLDVLGDHGTLVRLTKVDRIDDTNVQRFAAVLRTRFAQTYRQHIDLGLKLSVNGKLVKSADPLMRDHPETKVTLDTDLEVEGHRFHVTAVELPDLGFLGNQEAGIFPNTSGIYVVRNGRQIMAAQTFGLYRHHHSYSGLRIELSFRKDADKLFHVDVMKQKVQPDERLLAKLAAVLADTIAAAGRNGRDRPAPESATTVKLDHVVDVLNNRLARSAPPAPVATGKTKGKATPAPPTDDEPTGKMPHLHGGKDAEAAPDKAPDTPPARKPSVKFSQEPMQTPNKLFKAVEKDGVWLITLNTLHPLVMLVANARHKAASSVLTYMAFALATTAEQTRNGEDFIERIGVTLSSILGTPEA